MAAILEKPPLTAQPQMRFVIYAIIALIVTVFSVVFLQLISVGGVGPDLLLILCVWVALSEGQYAGMLFGFGVGLIYDITSPDVLGSNALAKTGASFVAGYFYSELRLSKNLSSVRFLSIIVLCAFVHNLIYFFLYIQPTEISFVSFFVKNGVASTLYTTVLAIAPMLWRSRSMER